jgi:hypothetical protein
VNLSTTSLQGSERKVFSQNGEDGVIEAIFATIGVTDRFFVEFGCEVAIECNSAHLLELGWRGLFMDGMGVSCNPKAVVHQEFVTAENVSALFRKYDVPNVFDLLSIDIDGNDYWVWKALAVRPRVLVIEYNAHVPPQESKVITYDPQFHWTGSDYFGASLRALKELGDRKGYTLVYCEQTGVNAFFVATEVLPSSFVPQSIEAIYRPPNFFHSGFGHPADQQRAMVDPEL